MNRLILLAVMGAGALPFAAAAAERTPVQACAIIHATYQAKYNADGLKGVAKYCKKFNPSDTAASATVRDKIAGGMAKRANSFGATANKKVDKIGGAGECDIDIEGTFPKYTSWVTADFATYLNSQIQFCDDRQF